MQQNLSERGKQSICRKDCLAKIKAQKRSLKNKKIQTTYF